MPKPVDPGKPAIPPGQKPKTPAQSKKQAMMRKVASQRPRPKSYNAPEEMPVRCFNCKHWRDEGLAFARCGARDNAPRWYFQMCPDYTPQWPEPVTVPQDPQPPKIEDDPGNLILD